MTTRELGQLLVDVRLVVGGVVVNTSGAEVAKAGGELSGVESAVVTWSRPQARLHEDAGQLDLVLRYDRPAAVQLDDKVELIIRGGMLNTHLGVWWVESVTWALVPGTGRTVWRYVITATSASGRAAGLRLSAQPWPAGHTLAQRLAAINAASPAGDLVYLRANSTQVGAANVAGRDVDYANALEVIQRTANTWGLVALDSSEGALALDLPALGVTLDMPVLTSQGNSLMTIRRPVWPILDVPASAIPETARELSRQGEVNRVTVGFYLYDTGNPDADLDDTERVFTAPPTGRPTSTLSIPTDWLVNTSEAFPTDPQTAWLGDVMDTAAAIVAEAGVALPRLGQVRVLLDRLDDQVVRNLLHVYYRASNPIQLAGAPADLDPWVRVESATITITGGRLVLDATLVALAPDGVRPFKWSDWPSPDNTPTTGIMGDPVPVRFQDLWNAYDQVTGRDLRLVDAPTAWKVT